MVLFKSKKRIFFKGKIDEIVKIVPWAGILVLGWATMIIIKCNLRFKYFYYRAGNLSAFLNKYAWWSFLCFFVKVISSVDSIIE